MECLEFRHAAGADPQHLSPEATAHRDGCTACRRFHEDMLALDDRILAALRIPATSAGTRRPAVVAFPQVERRRWIGLAASIVGGVILGTLLWLGGSRDSLASDVVKHMGHEPSAMTATTAVADPSQLADVLGREAVRLRPEAGRVSYAQSCNFRGRTVPHLVVQTDAGPVTVMVLRHEKVAAPVDFDEDGYRGTIVPAGPGSIAVIGRSGADLQQVAARVVAAVDWN